MSGAKANGRRRGREARMVMHEDEHVIIKAMVWKALGDDDFFGMFVSGDRSDSGRAEDRCALARFLARMERQFDVRANGCRPHHRIERPGIEVRLTRNGST